MSLNFLNFKYKKTEVMKFCPSGSCDRSPVDLSTMAPLVKPTVSKLDFKMDSDFELNCQIGAVAKSCFSQFLAPGKGKAQFSHKSTLEQFMFFWFFCILA